MKKILIIAYDFPPQGSGNLQRTVKYVKYLPGFGWEPYVLTVSRKSIVQFDYSQEKDIAEGTKIFRTAYPNPFLILDRRWVKKNKYQAKESVSAEGNKTNKNLGIMNIFKDLISGALNFIRRNFLIPEDLIIWLPFAFWRGLLLCYRNRIDVIFSTVPYFTNHLVGLTLKLITGKKWVVDYRNLWTGNPTRMKYSIRQKIERLMEALALKYSDKIVVCAKGMKYFLLKEFEFIPSAKITVINNGYDSSDFEFCEIPQMNGRKFNITYTGVIYKNYPLEALLLGFKALMEKDSRIKEVLRFNFLGAFPEGDKENFTTAIQKCGLCDNFFLAGKVARKEAILAQQKADVLLILYINDGPNINTVIPGKIYDYIAVCKPILAITPEGDTADIIRQGNCGLVVAPDDINGIINSLDRMFREFYLEKREFNPDFDYLKQYEKKYLTERLVKEVLN